MANNITAPPISNIPILSVPYKSTTQASWEQPLNKHIQSAYGDNPNDYQQELNSLHKLRQDMRGASSTADLTARDILLKYYGQLELLELHFPLDDGSVEVPFEWLDAFTNESTTQSSMAFEKACTIFNIAATFSRLAASTPRDVKCAYHYLQVSSGLFKFINDNFLHAPSKDISGETIKFLSDLMQAQAQEILLEKTLADKSGKVSKMTTKIAAGVAHLYSQLSAQCFQGTNLGMYLDSCTKVLSQVIAVKAKLFNAHAFMHRAILAESEAHYGEVVGRLAAAVSDLKDAERWAKSVANSSSAVSRAASSGVLTSDGMPQLVELVKISLSLANDSYTRANKDNDVIYHEQIPVRDSLSVLDHIVLPEFFGFDHVLPGGAQELQRLVGNDIFASLIPMHVHEKSSIYSEQKASVLRSASEMAAILDAEMSSSLTSLGFPNALEKLTRFAQTQSTNNRVLEELAPETQVKVSQIFGHSVPEFYNTVSAMMREVQTQLDDALQLLDADKALEDRIRSMNLVTWTLPPSAQLEQRRHITSLYDTVRSTNAQNAALYAEYTADILTNPILTPVKPKHLTCKSSHLTSQSSDQSLLDVDIGHSTMELTNQIKALSEKVGQLNTLKRERGSIVKELKVKMQTDDISELLVLNAKQDVDEHIFRTELSKYTYLTDKLKTNAASTRSAVKDIQSTWAAVQLHPQARKAAEEEVERQKLVLAIDSASLVNTRVTNNLTNSIQVATDLQDQAHTIVQDIQRLVAYRKCEAEKMESLAASTASAQSQTEFLRHQLSRMEVGPSNTQTNTSSLPAHAVTHFNPPSGPALNVNAPNGQYMPQPAIPYPSTAPYAGGGAYPSVDHKAPSAYVTPMSYPGYQNQTYSYSQLPGYQTTPIQDIASNTHSTIPLPANHNYPPFSNTYPSVQQGNPGHLQTGYSTNFPATSHPSYGGYSSHQPPSHSNPGHPQNSFPSNQQTNLHQFPPQVNTRPSRNLLD